ncbi:hypothetical protein SAMN05421788_110162 [Filimonas lacunae]|uniref:Uncharacterized protein n=1 Tax=Filimonas lacunae TaxID=477680 RepID=A0A173MAE5_9BACT|nr:hypothetical protein [Filimonas lacunae]BAV04428.1 hypothetical protein FLA_0419 [Filimonas lacunae]SIT31413.1 hypothetical protein SAMN05421788_110162 [Filimonas lacunae]
MAWSISITPEGWSMIREACHQQTRTFLIQAIQEASSQLRIKGRSKINWHLASTETLADKAFSLIEQTNTCDNGGFYYWIDLKGYYKMHLAE